MKRCMMDLETLGLKPGCVVLAIGAVMFDEVTGKLGETFYVTINQQSCLDAGLTIDPETMAWWKKQSPDARRLLDETSGSGGTPLTSALAMFTEWCVTTQYKDWLYVDDLTTPKNKMMSKLEMWGNGADFDNPILDAAYRAVGGVVPWGPFNGRCYRTLKSLFRTVTMKRVGTHHNALDDAKSQARHAINLLRVAQGLPIKPTWGELWDGFWAAFKAEFKWLP